MLARDFLRARSLGQLQAEHSAALLPLAGENLCRPAVDGNGKILPVRSRRTEACRDVPRPAFPQHGRKALFRLERRLVLNGQRFAAAGDVPVCPRDLRLDERKIFLSFCADSRTALGQLFVEHIQQTVRIRRLPVAFQKGVLLRHQPGIPAQKRHIARIKLT